ncbi:hypothetical protein C8R45DRAFT_1039593 [Mycena sanguinolenta]|nr:hypothetical protein C8R45DRAFT_1039593 [Mycena sanguinolenta]
MHEGSAGQSRLFANEYDSARYLRAETPFTSPPLPDDFDAVTQRWSRTTRVTTVEPTASGLLERLEATTRATTPALPKSRRRKNQRDDGHRQNEKLDTVQERSLRRTRRGDRIKASSVDDRPRIGPSAGQDYEIVKMVVLEENSDRTVSISTWREQAIEEADSDQDMSVYFVEPDDYILETGATVEILSRLAEANLASGSGNRNEGSRESSGNPRETKNSSADQRNRIDPHNEGRKTYRPAASPSPHSSGPRTSTPRGSGTLIHDAPADISHTAKGSSPFHAKKADSGSTISSIHLTPTLENILASCEPSLLHILPVLQTVGILGAEHLRAVGKLSEDTRNKEIKEEVLKLGGTVIEWAILLDKLQTL